MLQHSFSARSLAAVSVGVFLVSDVMCIPALAMADREETRVQPFAGGQLALLAVFLVGLTPTLSTRDRPGPFTWVALAIGLILLQGSRPSALCRPITGSYLDGHGLSGSLEGIGFVAFQSGVSWAIVFVVISVIAVLAWSLDRSLAGEGRKPSLN